MAAIRQLLGPDEAARCARMMSQTDPWITLGRGFDQCLQSVTDPGFELYLAEEDARILGFVLLTLNGAFTGYIRTLCVAPDRRGAGLGTALMAYAEERIFRERPNVFICVSDFNPGARRLYERLGYRLVGELTDYVVAGRSEFLLRKTTGPLSGALPEDRPPGG